MSDPIAVGPRTRLQLKLHCQGKSEKSTILKVDFYIEGVHCQDLGVFHLEHGDDLMVTVPTRKELKK